MNYGKEDLKRQKKPNIVDGRFVEEGDESGIANEFSSDDENECKHPI